MVKMNETSPIRVMIVDDHGMVRKGLAAYLHNRPELVVVGEGRDGREAIALCEQLHPDVILMDLVMPEMGGVAATHAIHQRWPAVKVIALTSFQEKELVQDALQAGAIGYLLKNASPEALLAAIRDVHRGEPSLSPAIAAKLMRELQRPTDLPPTKEPLTGREVDVLRLLAQGLSNEEIAAQLVIGVGTVRAHVSSILDKLHLANRTQAALYALREGLAPFKPS